MHTFSLELHKLALELHTCVLVHSKINTETITSLSKVIKHEKGEYHEFKFHSARKAGSFSPVYFRKNNDGQAYQISPEEVKEIGKPLEERKSRNLQKLESYCNEIFKEANELPKKAIYARLKDLILKRESDTYQDPEEQRFKTYLSNLFKSMTTSVLTHVENKPEYWRFSPV